MYGKAVYNVKITPDRMIFPNAQIGGEYDPEGSYFFNIHRLTIHYPAYNSLIQKNGLHFFIIMF